MSINLNAGVSRLAAIGVTASAALTLVEEAVSLVDTVEQLYEGLKGDTKFQAVEAGLKNVAAELNLTDKFDAIWKAMGPFVSIVVTIWNLANLWPHKVAASAK